MAYPTSVAANALGAEPNTTLSQHLQNISGELMEIINRLRIVSDRVAGTTPRAVDNGVSKVPSEFSLIRGVSDIRAQLGDVRDEISRLEDNI